jgi:hypothetical protein
MDAILNIVLLALVALIAYWWANQGLFSSILHCLCVMIAGAIALAFWEPVVVGFLLKGGPLDNYSWGLGLGGLFIVSLFGLRVVADRVAPANVKFPELVNNLLGGIVGLWAGVLTMGIAVIACGMIQAPIEIMGFVGWARTGNNNGAPAEVQKMWVPLGQITEGFYAMLSRGSLSPVRKTPLAELYPSLANTALSLHRDTFFDGDGRVSIPPSSVTIGSVTRDAQSREYALEFTVDTGAFDGGEQFILSAAQARLVSGGSRPEAVYPVQFNQPDVGGARRTFKFDDISNYASSVPGEQDARIILLFPAFQSAVVPEYVQIKGTRFRLPNIADGDVGALLNTTEESGNDAPDIAGADGGFAQDLSRFIVVRNTIMPAQLNTNIVPPMEHTTTSDGSHYISKGKGTYKKGATMSVSRSQRIRGFFHTPGTEIVLLDASRRDGGLDIYGTGDAAVKALGRDVPLELVDSRGKGYRPVGWVWERIGDVELCFEPGKPVSKLSDLPNQPSSGEHKLRLVFTIPTDTVISAIRVGKTVIGSCGVTVKDNGVTD